MYWMKLLCFVCLVAPLVWSVAYADVAPDAWMPTPMDARRTIQNDMRPPLKKMPETVHPPLPKKAVGVIRNVNLDKDERVCALTFDLCELATSTSGCDMAILSYLRQHQIPATLFMGGKWMRTHSKRVLQLLQEPLFEFGNHAWTHGNCALLSSKGLHAQVNWTQAQFELLRDEASQRSGATVSAKVPVLFRLPYGRCNAKALAEIAAMGMYAIQWDVVAERGAVVSEQEAKKMAHRVVKDIKPGSIVLFHANLVPRGSALLLKAVIALLKEQGYRFVTVGTLLGMGTPNRVMDGYFTHPKDNHILDARFGKDGTGLKTAFEGE